VAKKNAAVKAPAVLYLHCKCNQCRSWELIFDPNGDYYYLVCSTCKMKIDVGFVSIDPHASIHWEK
jgi:hypothetical protein